ncbi:MAG TPA: hypothetical protein DDW94_05830 [Deltaproteobacteria bacterium]|nr:hypothetical protein [Deltaproteobacteria bacterium]HCY10706.1 hypothetical protein [Deltaproteobacteria bacterium]
MDKLARIDDPLAEIERLKEEIEKANEREREFERTRRAMLYLLEDNNEYAEGLLKSKKEWETTFDSILEPILIHDEDMRILKCNRAYKLLAGMPFKEIIGKRYFEVFPRMEGPFATCKGIMNDNGPHLGEEEISVLEIDRIYRIRFYPISGLQTTSVHVLEDITEEKRAAGKESILYEFSREMTDLDLDFRLEKICETAVALGHRMAWIGLLDHETREIAPKAHAGLEDGYLAAIRVTFDDSPSANGPSGRAVKSGRPEVQNNIEADEGFAPWRQEALRRGYRSAAAFPIIESGRPIAILSVYSSKDEFPEREVQFLQTFANQTAVYIRNAKLFKDLKETSRRMEEEMVLSKHLLMISFATAHTTDIEKLMEHVVDCLGRIMETDYCLAYLWDRKRESFQPSAQTGLGADVSPVFSISSLEPDTQVLQKALADKGPVVEIFDGDVPAPFDWIPGLGTLVLIPLIRKEEWLGVLLCLYSGDRPRYAPGLTDRDREVLGGISYQVSTALDEAKLYRESIDKALDLSRKAETIRVMNEIDKSILSTLKPKEILEIAARMVSKIVSCDRATVALIDRERGGFVYEAGFGIQLQKGSFVPFKDTTSTEVVRTGRPQFVSDTAESARLPLEEGFFAEGFLSHLRVPLSVRMEIVGVLSVGARRKAAFTSEDLSVIEKLASQIGVALENSRLLTDLSELFIGIVRTLSEAIDAKSPWTKGHSDRVTKYALDIGRQMGFTEQDLHALELAGRLHDIGKLGTYEAILDKPGKLTDDEIEIIRRHPQKGADILAPIRQMQDIVPAIKHHHEFYDGNGYPEGLKGTQIPLMARILAVADTVDAMSADRPYRKGKSMEVIIAELKRCSGTQFDPDMVRAFLKTPFASGG